MLVKWVAKLLKNKDLSIEDRSLLTTAVLDKLEALPLRAIIDINEQGTLLVNGQEVDLEMAGRLKSGAKLLLDSRVRKLIHDQVAFIAITNGVHKVKTVDEMNFYRAAIWYGQQEDILLKLLAHDEVEA